MMNPTHLTRQDACPGTLTLHEAKDGFIGRLRFPGGRISAQELEYLSQYFSEAHITTRGNIQIRGIRDPEAFRTQIIEGGFLPYPDFDKVRNIIATPYYNYSLIKNFDEQLCSHKEIAQLSGRTLFGLDFGTGEILAQRPDFCLYKDTLYLAGKKTAFQGDVNILIHAAKEWAHYRGHAWRVEEKPDFYEHLHAIENIAMPPKNEFVDPADIRRFIGWLDQETGKVDLGAHLAFGIIPLKLLAIIGKPITVTPWRSILIHDLDEGEAEAVVRATVSQGFIYDRNSPWIDVSACIGSPGCAKSLSDVRKDALHIIHNGHVGERIHFSGCERRCGHPQETHLEYIAQAEGEYETIHY